MPEQTDAFLSEASLDEIKHLVSERAIQGETVLLNMGPQHPSTHGVLRLLLELDGEVVVNCIPDIGFLHTGVEKNMEAKTYEKAEVMTDRLDYLNTVGNNLVYCLAIEKLCELDVPPRAQAIRVILAELLRRARAEGAWQAPDPIPATSAVARYADAEGDIDPLALSLADGEYDADPDVLADALGLADSLADAEIEGLALSDALVLTLGLALPDADAETDGEADSLADAETDGEADPLADGL